VNYVVTAARADSCDADGPFRRDVNKICGILCVSTLKNGNILSRRENAIERSVDERFR
jgi:hypothetical protein